MKARNEECEIRNEKIEEAVADFVGAGPRAHPDGDGPEDPEQSPKQAPSQEEGRPRGVAPTNKFVLHSVFRILHSAFPGRVLLLKHKRFAMLAGLIFVCGLLALVRWAT